MANADIASLGGIEQLTQRLRDFETAGLPRPDNCLLSDYLRFLVDHELLSARAADHVESIYNNSRYGHSQVDADIMAKTVAELDAALKHLRGLELSEIGALAEILRDTHVADEQANPVPNRAWASSPFSGHGSSPDFPALDIDQVPLDFPRQFRLPNPRLRFWSRLLICGFLWTILAIMAGYFGHDKVSSAFQAGKTQIPDPVDFRTARRDRRRIIDNQRTAILAADTDEDRMTMMRNLAQLHLARREYAEYYHIYASLLVRDPKNANDKNSLAWFLLKSTDSWYRDPIRARQLAGEAVAVNPHPHYLDTLAEAMYQTGEPARAVELEQQALAADINVGPNTRHFFEEQLKKFREAMSRETFETAETIPPSSTE